MNNYFRNLFPFYTNNKEVITYLDNANTSQLLGESLIEINNYYVRHNYNIGRSSYEGSNYVSKLKDWAIHAAACFLGTKDDNIIFTSGATEGLNIIANSICNNIGKKVKVLTTRLEHASAIMPWMKNNSIINYIELNDDYTLNLDNVEKQIKENKPHVLLISSMTNTTGEIRPLDKLSELCSKYGIIFIVDHAQGCSHIELDLDDTMIDFLVFSLHKMYGPKGVGVIYSRDTSVLQEEKIGGGMNLYYDDTEYEIYNNNKRFYAGTENLPGIIGSIPTFELFINEWDNIIHYEKYINAYAYEILSRLPNITIYSKPNSSIFLFNIKGYHSTDITTILSSKNIYIRGGNHCCKTTDNLFGLSTCRASFSIYTVEEDIDALYKLLKSLPDVEETEII